jgi:hypothetical protein
VGYHESAEIGYMQTFYVPSSILLYLLIIGSVAAGQTAPPSSAAQSAAAPVGSTPVTSAGGASPTPSNAGQSGGAPASTQPCAGSFSLATPITSSVQASGSAATAPSNSPQQQSGTQSQASAGASPQAGNQAQAQPVTIRIQTGPSSQAGNSQQGQAVIIEVVPGVGASVVKPNPASDPDPASKKQPVFQAYRVTLPIGFNNAAEIATELVANPLPGVASVLAADDSHLLFVLDGSKITNDNLGQTEDAIQTAVTALSRTRHSFSSSPILASLPPGTSNATDIAAKIAASNIPGVTSVNAIGDSSVLFLIDTSADPKNPGKVRERTQLERDLRELVARLAVASPILQIFPLPRGKGHACDVVTAIGRQMDGILSMAPVDDTRILVGVDPAKDALGLHKRLQELIDGLAVPLNLPALDVDSITMRLYYNHNANAVAAVVNNAFSDVKASAVDNDSVLLSVPSNGSTALTRAQQAIAMIDQPRPQVTLNTWALQLSSDRKDRLDPFVFRSRRLANQYNDVIQESILRGWGYLSRSLSQPDFLDPVFSNYLTKQASLDPNGRCCVQKPGNAPGYGLGYETLFKPLPPHLVYMLMTLAASRDPRVTAITVLDMIEGRAPSGFLSQDEIDAKLLLNSGKQCQVADNEFYEAPSNQFPPDYAETDVDDIIPPARLPRYLALECVRHELGLLLARQGIASTSFLGQFRAALADFLYQNKMMAEYSPDFDPWSYPEAAAKLDAALIPIVDAFNWDMTVLQQNLFNRLTSRFEKDKHLSYGSGGLVTVKVVAGNQATAETASQNYFPQNPTMKLEDLASALVSGGSGGNASSGGSAGNAGGQTGAQAAHAVMLAGTLSSVVAAMAAYKAASPAQVTAKLGKGISVTATAYTLSSASGAELDINVMANENGAQMISANAAQAQPNDDLASRVSEQHVNTRVRMDSLKLFELSTMQSTIARMKTPWKPLDPVVELPLIDSLGIRGVRRKPDIIYHQSLVFIDATIVPTAADLGQTLYLKYDQVPSRRFPGHLGSAYRVEELGDEGWAAVLVRKGHIGLIKWFGSQYIDTDGQVRSAAPDPDCVLATCSPSAP